MAIARLSLKIAAPIILISVLAIGLTVFLNVGKLERTLSTLEESRLRFILNDLRANLETGLDLGLPLQSLGNAQAALEREAGRDPDVVSISVVDARGAVLFHTGRSVAEVAAAWRQSEDGKALPAWQAQDSQSYVVGATLTNNLGAHVGSVALRYSKARQASFIATVSRQLNLAALAGVLATTLCALFGIDLLVRRIGRTLDGIEQALEADAARDPALDPHAHALATQVGATARHAQRDLDDADSAIAKAAP